MIEKKALTEKPVDPLIAKRWSGRAYNPQRPVSEEQLISLLEAARWSPSCYGDQPWRFIVCKRDTDPQPWGLALQCLSEGNRQWAGNSVLFILVFADTIFLRNGKANRWAEYDTGAAAMSVCLQACSLGLMAHQMGGFDADQIQSSFMVPERYSAMAVIAIGYQLDRSELPETLAERELAPRNRRPLGDMFYSGSWGRPIR